MENYVKALDAAHGDVRLTIADSGHGGHDADTETQVLVRLATFLATTVTGAHAVALVGGPTDQGSMPDPEGR